MYNLVEQIVAYPNIRQGAPDLFQPPGACHLLKRYLHALMVFGKLEYYSQFVVIKERCTKKHVEQLRLGLLVFHIGLPEDSHAGYQLFPAAGHHVCPGLIQFEIQPHLFIFQLMEPGYGVL